MSSTNLQSPIFIGGQMKSGTTLLRSLLSQHPNIFGGLETNWFDLDSDSSEDSKTIQKLCYFYELSQSELDRVIRMMRAENIHFISALLNFVTLRANKIRWVEKTPDNIKYIDKIFVEFDNAYFIHVIRDYRDIYSSWKLANKGDIDDFIKRVKASYDILLDYRDHERYTEIKYENLVNRVDTSLSSVLQFINEKASASCIELNTHNSINEFNKVKAFTGIESSTLVSTQQKISTTKVGSYRNVLSIEEQEKIEKELDYFFSLFGARNDYKPAEA